MKHIKRSFSETAKRFMQPYFSNKVLTFKAAIMYSGWAIQPIIHVIFAQKIISIIENKQIELFWNTVFLYTFTVVMFWVTDFLMRKWGRVETTNAYRKVIHTKILHKFVKLSNTETEKIGT